jgi:Kelch motif protein
MKVGLALTVLTLMMGCFLPGVCAGQPVDATPPTVTAWVPTGNLIEGRYYHTATLLPNGKVLVVGGVSGESRVLDTAELYDPAIGTWTVTGRLNSARSGHSATLLPNGQVLVGPDNAELYDPRTETWKYTSSATGYFQDSTATLLRSGKVLFIRSTGFASLYDPAAGTWSSSASQELTAGFVAHQVTLLPDGRVLVTGGTNDADYSFGNPNVDIYDPVSDGWTRAEDLHVPRFGHSATRLTDGRVLVAGGDSLQGSAETTFGSVPPANNTAELFDPAAASWSYVGNLNTGRSGHTATLLPNGEMLVAGGWTFTPPNSGVRTKSSERYEARSAVWLPAGDLNAARSAHTATLLPNGKVLVVGGYGAGGVLNSGELYGPVPPGTIVPAFTGSWFDPAQNGHGLLIEVLPNNQFLAAWFAFNPAGTQQAWFVGTGTYIGNTATISDVVEPTGGRWIPNFDASNVVNNPWGTLKFTFTDCNNGKVDFASTLGYGSGSMNLTRLTQPAGLAC